MLRNYFKIAIRNLLKHKGYSFINIFGLAVGIGCCLLIFIFVKDELTYDRFQSKADRIYRVNSLIDWMGDKDLSGITGEIEAPSYAERIPEIEAYTRYAYSSISAQKGEEWVKQYNSLFTDPGTFEIFDYEVLSGSLAGALDDLNNVVISRAVAEKFFDKVDVAGEEMRIKLNGEVENYIVAAVYDDLPENSSLDAEIYFSWEKYRTFNKLPPNPWSNLSTTTIVMFRDVPDDVGKLEAKFQEVRLALNPDEEEDKWARGIESKLQPLLDIHLGDVDSNTGLKEPSEPTYSYILAGIGVLILVLACINFANLSVARSIPRAKEIGLRKVMGAQKSSVAWQFLGEALLVSSISFIIGLILAEFFLPVFGRLTNKTFTESIIQDPILISASFVFIIFTTVLAGSYPAFFVARFSILHSLSGRVKLNGRQYLTKGLVMFQFAIAAVLIIGTLTMYKQISFMLNTDLGYNDKNLAILNLGENGTKADVIASELSSNPNFEMISKSNGFGSMRSLGYGDTKFWTITTSVDTAFLNTVGLHLKAGRNLKHLEDKYIQAGDTLNNIIVSQSFIDKIEFDGDPIGLIVHDGGDEQTNIFRIVGVIDDFIYASAKIGLAPMAFITGDANKRWGFQKINIRYREGYDTKVQAALLETWRKVDPYSPMNFYFEEESNLNSYQQEKRWRSIITSASVIAIIISCLGLFGMAHLSAQQRQKEIGVRKVLGASVSQLIYMLNIGFTKMVMVSAIVAIPISYYFVEDWLSSFAFRIDLGVLIFVLPTAITLLIALSTVSIQSIRTANSNPVNSLRNE